LNPSVKIDTLLKNNNRMDQVDCTRINSKASAFLGGFPHPFHIAHRREAEEAFVLPVEVRGIVILYAEGNACCIEVFAEQKTAGFLES
jgi:hypothetical protein